MSKQKQEAKHAEANKQAGRTARAGQLGSIQGMALFEGRLLLNADSLVEHKTLISGIIGESNGVSGYMAPADLAQNSNIRRGVLMLDSITGAGAQRIHAYQKHKSVAPAPIGQEYVDPYLFETGHFESREEYEELSRTAKIKPRARA